ncbi:MAG: histidine kinase [Candidatus Riflebacteria bacterium HGW-Riflebacteria-1]|nr:MAG: histidine kinase [Candidatus Riflebacteria bacterium HGW-Riflebacteria-1]
MNAKAEKFVKMLKDNEIAVFAEEQLKDELNTVLFRSAMEIEGQRLPLVIVIDDSIYVLCRTLIAGRCITEINQAEVQNFLNHLNRSYKTFKYYSTEAGEIVMDSCLPTTIEQFEPNMVRAMIDLSVKNLEDNYRVLMQKVWGTTAEASARSEKTKPEKGKKASAEVS